MFQKGRVRFDIGIIVFFGGFFGFELLRLFITAQGLWQLLLFLSPLYVSFGWGGCGYVFPEFFRLWNAAENSPSLWRLRNFSYLGWCLFLGSSLAFSVGYSVPRQIFGQRFVYPLAADIALRGVLAAGVSISGIVAVVSKRMEYYGWRPRPAMPWSASKTLGVSSMIMMLVGLIILQAFALPAIVLFAIGGTIYMLARPIGDRLSNTRQIGGLPAPIKLDTGPIGFEKRLVIAKSISDAILRKHGKKILAVCLWGPSASEADPSIHSLDLAVVVRASEKYLPDQRFVYEGLEVVVAYWFEQSFIWRAKEFDKDWPFYRYEFSTLRVLYERDNWTRHLKPALDESDKADSTNAIREAAMSIVRQLGHLRESLERGDAREIRTDCSSVADGSGDLLLLLNRRYYQTSEHWNEILKCPVQPPDFAHLVDMAGGFAPVTEKERVEAALRLGEEMLEMVRLRGIALESLEPLV